MTDLDPKIWENPTLGSVGAGPFLPELEAQAIEDFNARHEGREPNVVEYIHRYPKPMESGSVPTVQQELEYKTPGGEVIFPVAEAEIPVETTMPPVESIIPVAEFE